MKIMFKKILILAMLFFLAPLAFAKDYRFTRVAENYAPDDIAFFDEENKEHFLEEYEGETLLLVFWATWCSPCVNEMASLDNLAKDFRKLNFKILPISEDYNGIDIAKQFYKDHKIKHLALMHDYKNALFKEFAISGLPISYIVDQTGKIKGKFTGNVHWHDNKVRETLLEHIPGNPPTPKNTYKKITLNKLVDRPKAEEKK
jgi:thiol-disulfide isomerase/thioredoxin